MRVCVCLCDFPKMGCFLTRLCVCTTERIVYFSFVSADGGFSKNRSLSQIQPSRENQIEVDDIEREQGDEDK